MRIKIYPYKQGSRSAKALAEAIGGKVLKIDGTSKYRPRPGDIVINWGSSRCPGYGQAKILNKNIAVAQNKLLTFQKLRESNVATPEFYTNADEIPEEAYPIVCRTLLGGHSGAGIVIADDDSQLVNAPLYTQYIKKKDEFRIHVVGGKIVFCQRKARKMDNDSPNWLIRNLANGFSFVLVPEDEVPEKVKEQSLAAIEALKLDFGGVDCIWNEMKQLAVVLEVNTAVGLEERSAQFYVEAIKQFT
jgi:glutathione synthase/RimK-type ligase-like ATP-grasp enzyme